MLIAPVRADELIGRASVVDGDTIEIHSVRIRLFGIDAPESDQLCRNETSDLWLALDWPQYSKGSYDRCGQKASNELSSLIDGRPVQCVEVDRDRYRRAVSVCNIDRTDIADWLVRNGRGIGSKINGTKILLKSMAALKLAKRFRFHGTPCEYGRGVSYRRPLGYVPGGLPWNWMLHFFAIEACSIATIWPFILDSSAAVCLSPPTKKAAGQKITMAAAVATPSFVRFAPDRVAALVDMA
jgi:Staphylococcal nuclease homologue